MTKKNLMEQVWEKGRKVDGFNPKEVRKDACGAFIIHDSTNKENDYAWEIDHIIPVSILETLNVPKALQDNIINLRPLNWHNIISKGNDCPRYEAAVIGIDESNVERRRNMKVNDKDLKSVLDFYKSNGFDIVL